MLQNVNEQKVLQALDRETRLFLALSACIMLALDRKICAHEALGQTCKVFCHVFPEKDVKKTEKTE